MPIKLKITLYTTFLVSIIVVLVTMFMLSVSVSSIEANIKNQLKSVVHENAEELEYENGQLELDDISFYKDHITTLIYSSDGYHLAGTISNINDFTPPLSNGEITPFTIDNIEYLLYDFLVSDRKYGDVYIRGITTLSEVSQSVENLFFATILSLPFFILFAGIGSYHISKKSLKPLEKIINTAEEISNGDDLSLRINLGLGKDEIHLLATTFDTMFSRLEQAFVSEKQFSSDVSHELRTPTSVILAECECILNSNATDEEKTEAFESIEHQGKKMQRLITALLNLIRLDNGVIKGNFENVDLSELILMTCEEYECIIPENVEIITDLPENICSFVDYELLLRVLSNLLDNAVKYAKTFIKVSLIETNENVILTIEDDGIGIAPKHLDKIFNRFYQVDSSRTNDPNGSMGLGLSMVFQIVKMHQGSINVESTLNEKTVFTITLPKK